MHSWGDKYCLEWTRSIGSHGYGDLRIKGNLFLAHRLSYILFNGEIPKDKYVCHTCDNRKCINPNHLYLGTAKDNYEDMVNKGRRKVAKEFDNHNCKLSNKDVVDIRVKYSTGRYSHRSLAFEYKVNHRLIGRIISLEERKNA